MIIKNNFNKNSVEPLTNYESVRRSCDNNVNNENSKHAKRFEKKIVQDLLKNEETLIKDDDEWDKWHF